MSTPYVGTILPHTGMDIDLTRVAPGRVVGRAPHPVDTGLEVITFHCEGCRSLVTVGLEHRSYYCVFKGKSVGIFTDAKTVNEQVEGVSGAFRLKYPSKEAAVEAFKNAMAEGKVEVLL
ncbi:hypothetical protein CC1G_03486 [Coprinopsis cinerea okayama7|uniref:Ribonuclease H1 N-terminal domain-containing protein n=1 Tax=Coprinopsis cinerea (strain Okayama-7 / 130 / ATCC MYA-4618 / FGSC 9003) TaxID=240176 RepID=A8NCC8_COPC7|nr:hypothetical protein CC1G_03486 [Coprinopsis cinerea okayama7\|eukprot:XP_001832472.1 hypothetical protein CC1G_03486 [Coprinopsis cinerea okayama7\